jgi:hypothetical protein
MAKKQRHTPEQVIVGVSLTPTDRQGLFDYFRRSADPEVRRRAHILLLLDAGHPWATISAVLFCSFSILSRWKQRFEKEGADAFFGRPGAGGGRASIPGRL